MTTNKKTLTKSGVIDAACYLRIIKQNQQKIKNNLDVADCNFGEDLFNILFSQHEQIDRLIYLMQNLLNDAEDL